MGNKVDIMQSYKSYIEYFLYNIEESKNNGEPFTTSTIVSSMLSLGNQNKGLECCSHILTYLRNQGYEVYFRPSQELWNLACLCSQKSKLAYPILRFNSTQNTDFIFLIKVCKIPDCIFSSAEVSISELTHPKIPLHIIKEFNQSKRKIKKE
jgi:hypothetical protein